MNAIKVEVKELYKCATCNTHYLDEKTAEMCCPKCECGMPVKKGRTKCESCLVIAERLKAGERFLNAEIIKEHELDEPYMLHDGSNYYQSVEDYSDHCDANGDDDEDRSNWLYVCRKEVPFIDASDIECWATDSMYEDAELPTEAREILIDACEKINQIIIDKNFCSFEMSWKKRVEVEI